MDPNAFCEIRPLHSQTEGAAERGVDTAFCKVRVVKVVVAEADEWD